MPRDGRYSGMAWMPRSVYAQRTRTVLARCHGRAMDATYQDNAGSNYRWTIFFMQLEN
jgi:hypothetical protein